MAHKLGHGGCILALFQMSYKICYVKLSRDSVWTTGHIPPSWIVTSCTSGLFGLGCVEKLAKAKRSCFRVSPRHFGGQPALKDQPSLTCQPGRAKSTVRGDVTGDLERAAGGSSDNGRQTRLSDLR